MRQLFGILTALTTSILIIFMAQFIRDGIFPYPTGMNYESKPELIKWTQSLPLKAFMIIAFSHSLATFAAGFITSLTVGRKRMTLGVLSFTIVLALVTLQSYRFHLSVGFIAIDVLLMITLGFVGALLGSNRYDM
jgi:hypothetical protein